MSDSRQKKCGTIASSDGFTLMELLLATFILVVVISTVYGSYRATFHVIDRTEEQLSSISSGQRIIQRISDDLNSIVTIPGGLLVGETSSYNGSRGDSLSFVSANHLLLSQKEGLRGRTMIRYTVEIDEQTQLLNMFRSDSVLLPGTEDSDSPVLSYLIGKGLAEVRFNYVGQDGGETDTWDSRENSSGEKAKSENPDLPRRVEIELRFGDESDNSQPLVFKTGVALPKVQEEEK